MKHCKNNQEFYSKLFWHIFLFMPQISWCIVAIEGDHMKIHNITISLHFDIFWNLVFKSCFA